MIKQDFRIRTNHYTAAKTLLRNGADPNLPDAYTQTSALMRAADYGRAYERSTAMLALLLAHGGGQRRGAEQQARRTAV